MNTLTDRIKAAQAAAVERWRPMLDVMGDVTVQVVVQVRRGQVGKVTVRTESEARAETGQVC